MYKSRKIKKDRKQEKEKMDISDNDSDSSAARKRRRRRVMEQMGYGPMKDTSMEPEVEAVVQFK